MGFRLLGYLLRALPFGLLGWFLAVVGWLGYAVAVLFVLGVMAAFALTFLTCIATGNMLIDEGNKRAHERHFAKMSARERSDYALLQKQMAEGYSAARENS